MKNGKIILNNVFLFLFSKNVFISIIFAIIRLYIFFTKEKNRTEVCGIERNFVSVTITSVSI